MTRTLDQILKDQNSRLRLSLTVFCSLLIAAVVLMIAKQVMGWVFLCMMLLMGAALFMRVKRYREETAKLGDREAFSRQMAGADTLQLESFGLTLTREAALLERPYLQVYRLEEMARFEVGLAGDAKKVLFLTDRERARHPIAETAKGDAKQVDFDRAYNWVRDWFHQRDKRESEVEKA